MMSKKLSFWSLLVFAALAFTVMSCNEDSGITPDSVENFEQSSTESSTKGKKGKRGKKGGQHFDCFEVIYPVSIVFADGSSAEVSSKEEARDAKREWFEANDTRPNRENRPTFAFPISVEVDGETVELADEDALKALLEDCHPKGGGHGGQRGGCFEMVYPITMVFADGSQAEVNSREEKHTVVRAWYEDNDVAPSRENRPSLSFPITVIMDGEEISVADEAELKALHETCKEQRGDGHGKKDCFTLVFPVSFDFNGEVVSFDDRQSIREAIRQYKRENGRQAPRPEMVFPVSVEYQDGTTATAESKEVLRALKEDC